MKNIRLILLNNTTLYKEAILIECMAIATKLPNFKKKCKQCGKFFFIKSGWNYCMGCYEKRFGKYTGADRHFFV